PVTTTSAPWAASSTAVARPMPRRRPAPVTMATLPSSTPTRFSFVRVWLREGYEHTFMVSGTTRREQAHHTPAPALRPDAAPRRRAHAVQPPGAVAECSQDSQ